VILPLIGPGMIAVAVFVVVYAWNEFLFAFIFTTTHAKTAPLVISEMIGAVEGVEWGVLFAASTIQLLPVLAFVVFAQKHLIAGLTAGATKG
jgi:multiple sugar transport system permease protein